MSKRFFEKGFFPIGGFSGPAFHKGDEWELDHFKTDEYFKLIKELGVDFMVSINNVDSVDGKRALALYDKYDIGFYFLDDRVYKMRNENKSVEEQEAFFRSIIDEYKSHPCYRGPLIADEPHFGEGMEQCARTVEAYLRCDREHLPYVNLLPSYGVDVWDEENEQTKRYPEYLEEYCKLYDLPYISYDNYVFYMGLDYKKVYTNVSFFADLNDVSYAAKRHGKRFWAFVQAGGQWGQDRPIDYFPNELQYKWNLYVMLAFGMSGLQYFPLVNSWVYHRVNQDPEPVGLIGYHGNKTRFFDYALKINRYVKKYAYIFAGAEHLGVLMLGGSAARGVSGKMVISGNKTREIIFSESNHAVVGVFEYEGRTLLYVVNNSFEEVGYAGFKFNAEYDFDIIQKDEHRKARAEEQTEERCLFLTLDPAEAVFVFVKDRL